MVRISIDAGIECGDMVYWALHGRLLHMPQPGQNIYIYPNTPAEYITESTTTEYNHLQNTTEHTSTITNMSSMSTSKQPLRCTSLQRKQQRHTPKSTNLKLKHSQKGNSARCHLSHPLFCLVHRSIQQNHGYSILFSQQM